jgi:hypothetical protein
MPYTGSRNKQMAGVERQGRITLVQLVKSRKEVEK